jgi:hypothetical protein
MSSGMGLLDSKTWDMVKVFIVRNVNGPLLKRLRSNPKVVHRDGMPRFPQGGDQASIIIGCLGCYRQYFHGRS